MRFYCLLIAFLCSIQLIAQPQPCDPVNPQMTSFCADACVICDIDGFTGVNNLTAQGQGFSNFCTTQYNNMQYIAFVAGSVDLTIRVDVSNCQGGAGSLELGFFQSEDCQNFTAITFCDTEVFSNQNQTFTNDIPLTIGQYYYLVIDGSAGSNCSWTFTVLDGTTELAPLTFTRPIIGVDRSCPGVLQTFFTEPEIGATIFNWTIDGQLVGDSNSPELQYTFTENGTYNLCVTARNTCDQATPTCKLIEVVTIPQIIIDDVFCEGDCYEVADTTICDSGEYVFNFKTAEGCDSVIIAVLEELVQADVAFDLNICNGDTIFIDEMPYTTTGLYQQIVLTEEECDSIVNLDLFIVECIIETSFTAESTICHNTPTGSFNVQVINGTPPFTFSWRHLQTDNIGSGTISGLNMSTTIPDLLPGDYVVEIQDGFGNYDVFQGEVPKPPALTNTFVASDFDGFNVSCFNSDDGMLTAVPDGGVPPYSYLWADGTNTASIDGLTVGTYEVVITDDVGCTKLQSYTLISPDSVNINVDFQNPNCDGFETGVISLINVNGGYSPYVFALDNGIFSEEPVFTNLGPETYTYQVKDNNGCENFVEGTLVAPDIPVIDLGEDLTINLGDSISLEFIMNNTNLQLIEWTGETALSCTDCLRPIVRPFDDASYEVMVTSADGCTTTDNITITVEKLRQFYMPNAFSPNFDGINDVFALYGGQEVASYDLSIFDRWGEQLYEAKNINHRDISAGWDGQYRGKAVSDGVYVWLVNIHFIDGVDMTYSGDITVIH